MNEHGEEEKKQRENEKEREREREREGGERGWRESETEGGRGR